VRGLLAIACLVLAGLAACSKSAPPPAPQRTLAEAREIVLKLFAELDGFTIEKQTEVGLDGHPAVRMEGEWKFGGQRRRGVIYVVDHPAVFNVIHYTAPDENGLFDGTLPVFQAIVKSMKPVQYAGPIQVTEQGDEKILRSADLLLEFRYPSSWVYTLDEVNRALVLSGPREDAAWMATVNFSVINKGGG
jgi:hypothetical protein